MGFDMLNRGCRDWNFDDFLNRSDFEQRDLLDRRRDDLAFDDLVQLKGGQFCDWNRWRFEMNFECCLFQSDLK